MSAKKSLKLSHANAIELSLNCHHQILQIELDFDLTRRELHVKSLQPAGFIFGPKCTTCANVKFPSVQRTRDATAVECAIVEIGRRVRAICAKSVNLTIDARHDDRLPFDFQRIRGVRLNCFSR